MATRTHILANIPDKESKENCLPGLPSKCYVRDCQLGQLPGQARGGAWEVGIQ